MPIVDQYGNKLPQSRIKKKAMSLMVRSQRMQESNPRFCGDCGFAVRGTNHKSGRHHQEAPKVIEAAIARVRAGK